MSKEGGFIQERYEEGITSEKTSFLNRILDTFKDFPKEEKGKLQRILEKKGPEFFEKIIRQSAVHIQQITKEKS